MTGMAVPMGFLLAGMILGIVAWIIIDLPSWVDGVRDFFKRRA